MSSTKSVTDNKTATAFDYTSNPVGTFIDRTMKIIKSNYTQVFKESGVDITTEQWVILDKLYDKNGLSQTQVANDTFKNTATVSRIIDLLCSKDLIERQRFENDRRRYKIFLTKPGKALVEKLRPAVFELRKKGWKNISEKEYHGFLKTINQIYSNFEP
jgi:DNA-binding MarR family transcriptional regulator